MINPNSKKLGIFYLGLGLAGAGIGLAKVLPVFINVLQGKEIILGSILPWLVVSLVMLGISGFCLWRFSPAKLNGGD